MTGVCPVLCSAHGHYGGGVCHCEEGWKGAECDIPMGECEVPNCSNRGRCIEGECRCERGWKGPFCDKHDCLDPLCGGHGTCVAGQCYCKAGWQGADCSTIDQQVYQCLPGCSEHGTYDLETGQCVCERHWTGPDCSQAVCSLDCGPNGVCESGKCRCNPGWTGNLCDQLPCDARCSEHGQCKNGTCVCSQGWNGRHCTLPGCENGCSRHGQCTLENGEYRCDCIDGWAGTDCSIPLEQNCKDNIDNDGVYYFRRRKRAASRYGSQQHGELLDDSCTDVKKRLCFSRACKTQVTKISSQPGLSPNEIVIQMQVYQVAKCSCDELVVEGQSVKAVPKIRAIIGNFDTKVDNSEFTSSPESRKSSIDDSPSEEGIKSFQVAKCSCGEIAVRDKDGNRIPKQIADRIREKVRNSLQSTDETGSNFPETDATRSSDRLSLSSSPISGSSPSHSRSRSVSPNSNEESSYENQGRKSSKRQKSKRTKNRTPPSSRSVSPKRKSSPRHVLSTEFKTVEQILCECKNGGDPKKSQNSATSDGPDNDERQSQCTDQSCKRNKPGHRKYGGCNYDDECFGGCSRPYSTCRGQGIIAVHEDGEIFHFPSSSCSPGNVCQTAVRQSRACLRFNEPIKTYSGSSGPIYMVERKPPRCPSCNQNHSTDSGNIFQRSAQSACCRVYDELIGRATPRPPISPRCTCQLHRQPQPCCQPRRRRPNCPCEMMDKRYLESESYLERKCPCELRAVRATSKFDTQDMERRCPCQVKFRNFDDQVSENTCTCELKAIREAKCFCEMRPMREAENFDEEISEKKCTCKLKAMREAKCPCQLRALREAGNSHKHVSERKCICGAGKFDDQASEEKCLCQLSAMRDVESLDDHTIGKCPCQLKAEREAIELEEKTLKVKCPCALKALREARNQEGPLKDKCPCALKAMREARNQEEKCTCAQTTTKETKNLEDQVSEEECPCMLEAALKNAKNKLSPKIIEKKCTEFCKQFMAQLLSADDDADGEGSDSEKNRLNVRASEPNLELNKSFSYYHELSHKHSTNMADNPNYVANVNKRKSLASQRKSTTSMISPDESSPERANKKEKVLVDTYPSPDLAKDGGKARFSSRLSYRKSRLWEAEQHPPSAETYHKLSHRRSEVRPSNGNNTLDRMKSQMSQRRTLGSIKSTIKTNIATVSPPQRRSGGNQIKPKTEIPRRSRSSSRASKSVKKRTSISKVDSTKRPNDSIHSIHSALTHSMDKLIEKMNYEQEDVPENNDFIPNNLSERIVEKANNNQITAKDVTENLNDSDKNTQVYNVCCPSPGVFIYQDICTNNFDDGDDYQCCTSETHVCSTDYCQCFKNSHGCETNHKHC